MMSPPFHCLPKFAREWNLLKNYGKHRMNSKRIISFGKQWQRLKRLQLFLDKNRENDSDNGNNNNDKGNKDIARMSARA